MANKWKWADKPDAPQQPMVNNSPSAGAYGYRWRKRRKAYLANNALCIACLAVNKTTTATDIDHIIPHRGQLSEDVFWCEDNWQALCSKCHARKTNNETFAGRRTVVTGLAGAGKTTYVQAQSATGDIIFDYDLLMEAMVIGHKDKRTNPRELIGLIEAMRYSLLSWINTTATRRSVWVICTNKNTATVIAQKMNGQVIDLA